MFKKIVKKFTLYFCIIIISCFIFLVGCKTENNDPNKYSFDNAAEVRVMSFNIRVGEQTEVRRSAVIQNITEVDPDVFGVQEADPAWITYIQANLPNYTLVGEGRDGGKNGEYAAIFYKTEQYTLIQGGTKWLSLSPNTPSILDGGSQYKRVVTYAKLQDKDTGSVFVHLNAHLDYSSDEIARQQINIVCEYAQNFVDYPTFITGDFNQIPTSATYAEIVSSGFLDSSLEAPISNRVNTYTGYNASTNEHDGQSKLLDYCFVSPFLVQVDKYDTWNKPASNGGHNGFISDHYAIYADCKYINVVDPTTIPNELNNTIFQCGTLSYGDISYNDYAQDGVTCNYDNNTILFTVEEGVTLTLPSLKTANDVSVYIDGKGSVVINGNVQTKSFIVSKDTIIDVKGEIKAKEVDLGKIINR